jgi:hypothetical protein
MPFGSAYGTYQLPLYDGVPIGIGGPLPSASGIKEVLPHGLQIEELRPYKGTGPNGMGLYLSARALRQQWRKRGWLYRKRRGGGPGACGPLCCKCFLDPTPLSREWAGLVFPSGHPVAAEKEKGWAPRGSPLIVKR